jgi:hypothetical protein
MSPLAPWTVAAAVIGILMVTVAALLPADQPVLAVFGGLIAGFGVALFVGDLILSRSTGT